MRFMWAVLVVVVCGGLAMAMTASAATQERPTEGVTPAPEVNPNAVVWRTPEPPTDPQAGDVWVNPKDGMEMVYVPAGEFTLGASDAEIDTWLRKRADYQRSWFADEQPQCPVNLEAYWIGRREVINEQYARFVRAAARSAPHYWEGGRPPPGLESFPVLTVTWDDARAYCEWAGGRLPTELEWEKAARGTEGGIFPWGNEWDGDKCRNFETVTGRSYENRIEAWSAISPWCAAHDEAREGAVAAGSYLSGASPYGCLDMAGNALEWCEDWYQENAYKRYADGDFTLPKGGDSKVVRGGSWASVSPAPFRCSYRFGNVPGSELGGLGFRCARDRAPAAAQSGK